MSLLHSKSVFGLSCAVSLATGLLSAGTLSAKPLQKVCYFTHVAKVTDQGMQRADLSLHVDISHPGRSGRVNVDGSGVYKAKAICFESGATEYRFRTGASKEEIMISPQGDALWDIRFFNEDYMVYVGTCDTIEVTS
ncbi:hypothetical protein ACFP4H_17330 [Pseudophaeobacter arcticus]|uniref:hypothetical protein n=1 Tax=Pseudophaeobacter arcticus TaxID=385492 RepID=UPI0012B61E0F|nr:hypothetical protein [Pseudophaeobacter arcticus]